MDTNFNDWLNHRHEVYSCDAEAVEVLYIPYGSLHYDARR